MPADPTPASRSTTTATATRSATGKNPRRVAAGRANGRKRRAWTADDRDRLRAQCLARQPWAASTGPRTAAGKARAAANARPGHRPGSARGLRAELADVPALVAELAALRRSLAGG